MGRKIKRIEFRPIKSLQNMSYHTEMHHTCTNTAICRKVVSPCEKCGDCRFYKLREVEVANMANRFLEWGA